MVVEIAAERAVAPAEGVTVVAMGEVATAAEKEVEKAVVEMAAAWEVSTVRRIEGHSPYNLFQARMCCRGRCFRLGTYLRHRCNTRWTRYRRCPCRASE